MIKLSNLEKYFNKNKNNEIHVINDINLELPKTGLVVLLGPSGSGKTTLLNVIGGLDKVGSGIIDFDGEILSGYKSNQWDRIRNDHIGYVFQNYNLLTDISVYENIALSLRMSGINDPEEIETRINYILENVGMYNFRRRKAAALSGGQQQRIAIARALAKNPKVIIADEPTGNLDSKNTYDIMNILRSISKTKLVVLVTHEENIADMYADRIIRLKDGQITEDIINRSTGGVDVQIETDIYLKDLESVAVSADQNTSLKVYSDHETDASFNVRLIVKDNTLYVDVDSDQFKRINLLNKESEIKIIDDHFQEKVVEEFTETEFNLEEIIDESKKEENRSIITNKEAFRLAWNRFKQLNVGKVFMYIMFFFLACGIATFLGLLYNVVDVDATEYLQRPRNTVEVTFEDKTYDHAITYLEQDHIEFIQIVDSIRGNLSLPDVYQAKNSVIGFSGIPVLDEFINTSKIIEGRTVEDQNELVITKNYADSLLQQTLLQSLGVTSYKDLTELSVQYYVTELNGEKTMLEANIVGIVNVDDVAVYAKEETIFMMASGFAVYEAFSDDLTITDTSDTDHEYKVYINDEINALSLDQEQKLSKFFDSYIYATFDTSEDIPVVMYPLEDVKEHLFDTNYDNLQPFAKVQFYSSNPSRTETYLADYGQESTYLLPVMQKDFLQNRVVILIPFLLFAGLFLVVSSVSSFFILRSSLLARIYEVSVYRALGAMKRDIRKIFLIESLLLTFMTSLWGYLATSYIIYRLQSVSLGGMEYIKITPISFIIGIGIIFAVNLYSGLIPVSNLLRKTPAEIISKYDF